MNNDGRITQLLKRAETFGDKAKLESLLSRFDKFSEVETVEALEHLYMPKIDKFSKYIDHIDNQIDEMKIVIQDFDQNLSLKANKNLLQHSFKELESGFMKKEETWEEIN